MKTSQLLHELDLVTRLDSRTLELDIQGIADNSKVVEEGFAFIAIEGFESDGHLYIEQAVEKGGCNCHRGTGYHRFIRPLSPSCK
ncbi:hypothetical protein [Planococcus donghaensis]|uniref:hypothetical protein n=1 Tax=Planococcus donghaensis TaxID=414778 RepID=UPI003734DF9E